MNQNTLSQLYKKKYMTQIIDNNKTKVKKSFTKHQIVISESFV